MNFDSLSTILESFPLRTVFAGRLDLNAPWGVMIEKDMMAALAVTKGSCWIDVEGYHQNVLVAEGEVFFLSLASSHWIQDEAGSLLVSVRDLIASSDRIGPSVLASGGNGSRTTLWGGIFSFDTPRIHPFGTLPSIIHLGGQEAKRALPLEALTRLIDFETSAMQAGGKGVVERLAQILLVHTIRSYLAKESDQLEPWSEGILHTEIGRALAMMHRHPERSWSVAELAAQAVMSRSAFSATFVEVVGKPPMRYLREHRMQLASRLLGDSILGLKEIASRVGYDSVSAFSTAFKRLHGLAPDDYRHEM